MKLGHLEQILRQWSRGEGEALDRLLPLVQPYLKRMASTMLNEKFGDLDLESDELVSQVYLCLKDKTCLELESVSHFYRFAGKVMQCFCTDLVRKKNAAKNWGGLTRTDLGENNRVLESCPDTLLTLNGILRRLQFENPLMYRVAVLRSEYNCTIMETATLLDIPTIKVNRLWRCCKNRFLGEFYK